jgi:hypothetical protein
MQERLSRRQALRKAAAITILPAGLARGFTANEKLNLGVIGLTGTGAWMPGLSLAWARHHGTVRRG